jgi:hypothetical protein
MRVRSLLVSRDNWETGQYVVARSQTGSSVLARSLTSRNNNNYNQDDDTRNQAHSHLHVLPPHLLAHPVGAAAEALGGNSQVVGLILKGIETLATLRHLVYVLSHYTNGVIDLLYETKSAQGSANSGWKKLSPGSRD